MLIMLFIVSFDFKKLCWRLVRFDSFSSSFADDDAQSPSLSSVGRLRFSQFDIAKVLKNSTHLMASEGKEFDLEEDASSADIREKMAKQRQILNARLGLDVAAQIGIDTSNLFTNEDLMVPRVKQENSDRNNEAARVRAGTKPPLKN